MWLPVFPVLRGGRNFRLLINTTNEVLSISKIGADIPNRGSIQNDIHFLSLHYLQRVSDAQTHGLLHIEPGLLLNLPLIPSDPNPNVSIVGRLATVPHGNALLAQGRTSQIYRPTFAVEDTTPISAPTPIPPDAKGMLLGAVLPRGIPPGAARNPNLVLSAAIARQNITNTIKIEMDTNFTPSDGIKNIPFIVQNADATSMRATFWIETIKQRDGSLTLQLQYTQKVILKFGGIDWPHVTVATLVRQ
jgi:hypothetical protein